MNFHLPLSSPSSILDQAWSHIHARKTRITQEFEIDVNGLPRGVLVGTVEIVGCLPLKLDDSQAACFEITETHGFYAWLLARPHRAEELVKPKNQPQPMFFNPF